MPNFPNADLDQVLTKLREMQQQLDRIEAALSTQGRQEPAPDTDGPWIVGQSKGGRGELPDGFGSY